MKLYPQRPIFAPQTRAFPTTPRDTKRLPFPCIHPTIVEDTSDYGIDRLGLHPNWLTNEELRERMERGNRASSNLGQG